MSDQEPGPFYPSDDQDCDENREMESRDILNYEVPVISDQLSLWHQNATPPSPSFCMEEIHKAAHYSNMLDDLSRFEVPSFPLQEVNLGKIPCSNDILNTLEEGQSSGAKRRHASDFLEMQTKEGDLQEDGVKEDSDTSDQSKQQKTTRCAEVHNKNERLRRLRLKEKMKALQELIPNCKKRDKTSILDDAVKYIKTLEHQIQIMSIGADYTAFHSPLMMMQQKGPQEMQIPSSTLLSFLQTGLPGDGKTGEIEHGIGMGTSGMYSLPNFPMSQVGLPNPCFLPSSLTSRLPAPGGIQNPENFNFLGPSNLTSSFMDSTPFYATVCGFQSTTQGPISEQSCSRRESAARVMPSKIVAPHLTKEVVDCGSSLSTSSEWSSSSTAK